MCSFSEDGEHIFAGCNDCCVYIWHWDLDLARDQADRLGTFDRLDIKDPNKLRYMWCAMELPPDLAPLLLIRLDL